MNAADATVRAGIESNLAELRKFAVSCPANFEARAHLAAAEYDRACGRHAAAESAFKLAIRAARRQGEAGTEALACELARRHAASLGDDVIGTISWAERWPRCESRTVWPAQRWG